MSEAVVTVTDLGIMEYAAAYAVQSAAVERVVAARETADEGRGVGEVFFVEHPAVITISNRAGARANLIASDAELQRAGVAVCETDRGGDITYHGPGQLVVYPILDLNMLGLRLHDYMRMLEGVVIGVCARFGVHGARDRCATGVWVMDKTDAVSGAGVEMNSAACAGGGGGSKICAMGVRVKRWVSMHGLALNVTTDLRHFALIVPCGLAGRGVTSLRQQLRGCGQDAPAMAAVKAAMREELVTALTARRAAALKTARA